MPADDKCVLSQISRGIQTVSEADRCVLSIPDGARRQLQFGQAAVAERFHNVLASSVVGSDHHAVVAPRRRGPEAEFAVYHRRGVGQLRQDHVVRFAVDGEGLVDVFRQQSTAVADVYCSLCTYIIIVALLL